MKLNKTFVLGASMVAIGLTVLGSVTGFYIHSHYVGSKLLQQANVVQPSSSAQLDNINSVSYHTGNLIGLLTIPKIQLEAPIVEGTDEAQIDVAAGHLPSSVLPGQFGTSVIAAHNATWFRHVDRLKQGDAIRVSTKYGTYNFRVTKSQIVHTGSPIYNTTGPSLVLESCYPLNALYLTPYRYLVYAELVSQSKSAPSNLQATASEAYHVEIPASIPTRDTLLSANPLPMGTLAYSGSPASAYVQSNSPLNASSALVQLYLAWLHASATKDAAALHALGVPDSSLLTGVTLSRLHTIAPFDVTLNVSGTHLVNASAVLEVQANHRYTIHVYATRVGDELKLERVAVVHTP